MNEEVAKTRICPIFDIGASLALLTMVHTEVSGKIDSTGVLERKSLANQCKGSNCMLWRRAMPGYGGYCGLGGKITNE